MMGMDARIELSYVAKQRKKMLKKIMKKNLGHRDNQGRPASKPIHRQEFGRNPSFTKRNDLDVTRFYFEDKEEFSVLLKEYNKHHSFMDNLAEDDNKKGVGGVDIDKQNNILKYEYSINGKIFQNDLCQKNKPTKKDGIKDGANYIASDSSIDNTDQKPAQRDNNETEVSLIKNHHANSLSNSFCNNQKDAPRKSNQCNNNIKKLGDDADDIAINGDSCEKEKRSKKVPLKHKFKCVGYANPRMQFCTRCRDSFKLPLMTEELYFVDNAVKPKNRLTLCFGCIGALLKERLSSNNNDDVVLSIANN